MGRTTVALSTLFTGLLLAPLAVAGPAAAALLESGREFEPFEVTDEDFCGVTGLTVNRAGTFELRYRLVSRGAQQLPYFAGNSSFRQTITNPDTDLSVTESSRVLDKDLRVTDNGDGTFTILVLATGSALLKDSSGRVIAANPGQIRYEVLIDNNHTPSDPSDDDFIAFLGTVKESTGRNDDFCGALVDALT